MTAVNVVDPKEDVNRVGGPHASAAPLIDSDTEFITAFRVNRAQIKEDPARSSANSHESKFEYGKNLSADT